MKDNVRQNTAMGIKNRKVVAVVFDRTAFFELGIAVEVFGLPRPEFKNWYEFSVCSPEEGPLSSYGGVQIAPGSSMRSLSTAGTIIVPGWRNPEERPPEKALRALARAHERGARIVSFCSGAFVLAAAGLLDGRDATTHWMFAEKLAQMYPEARVNPNVLYVHDGNLLTAAGSAAGIDLSLYLIRQDFGAETANRVARRLVVPPHRDGGQAQFIAQPVTTCEDDGLATLLDWLAGNLSQEHTVASMARRASMSPRTFARKFRDQTGTTPAQWLARERVQFAQRLLETTNISIEHVAIEAGFGTAQLMRFHFQRTLGSTPSAFRNAFCPSDAG